MSLIESIRGDKHLYEITVVSVGNDRSINFWNTNQQKLLYSLPNAHKRYIHDVTCIDEESLLTCGDDVVKLWSISSMKSLRTFVGHEDTVRCITCMDSRTVVSGSDDCNLHLWKLNSSSSQMAFKGHTNYVSDCVKVSKKKFVSSSFDSTIRMWDIEKCRQMHIARFSGYVYCLDCNITFRLFAAGAFGGKIHVYNKDFRKLFELQCDHTVSSIHVVSDKNFLICGDIYGSLYCWDMRCKDQKFWEKKHVHKRRLPVQKIISLTDDYYASTGADGSLLIDSYFHNFDGCQEDAFARTNSFYGQLTPNSEYHESNNSGFSGYTRPYSQYERTSDSEYSEEEFILTDTGEVKVVKHERTKIKRVGTLEDEFAPKTGEFRRDGVIDVQIENEWDENTFQEPKQEQSSKQDLNIDTNRKRVMSTTSSRGLLLQSGVRSTISSPADHTKLKFKEKGPIRSLCVMRNSHLNIFLKKNEIREKAMKAYKKKKELENQRELTELEDRTEENNVGEYRSESEGENLEREEETGEEDRSDQESEYSSSEYEDENKARQKGQYFNI